jgi:hypothetical protein
VIAAYVVVLGPFALALLLWRALNVRLRSGRPRR